MDKNLELDSLTVPSEAKIRNAMRLEAKKLVESMHISPPASFQLIQEVAMKLLVNLNVDASYLNFATVLIGNETWREIVAATPYNRRLLLLPQCLHKNDSCKAEIDELGLICAGCNSCNINGLLEKAEAIGYTCLVAEGTTVAVGLVEEGAIDAVLGVTCMDVLKRSYDKVSRSAVPVLGIPLLHNGCEETEVDMNWLQHDLHDYTGKAELLPVSVSVQKEQIQDYFDRKAIKEYFTETDITTQKALQSVLIGGKRMRPLLAAIAYEAYIERVVNKTKLALSLVVECFHKASLIHDDIQDNDALRYNLPTLHQTDGIALAINVGDFLIGKGYQILAGLPVEAERKVKALQIIASSHVNLSIGQGEDLYIEKNINTISLSQLEKIYEQKTGEAIKVAILLGAVVGGADVNECEIISQFSNHFGIAYQIKDDIDEFEEQAHSASSKDYPILLVLLNAELQNGRQGFEATPLNQQELRQLIEEHNILDKARGILQKHIDSCFEELDKLQNIKLKLSLYRMMAKIF